MVPVGGNGAHPRGDPAAKGARPPLDPALIVSLPVVRKPEIRGEGWTLTPRRGKNLARVRGLDV
jgi:hypothetical protein